MLIEERRKLWKTNHSSWIKYTYNDDSMNYTTLTSSGETTKTVYNDAFLPVEYTDNQALKQNIPMIPKAT